MISVDEAWKLIAETLVPLSTEEVTVGDVAGRVIAADALSKITQPPSAVSAMDGYAVSFRAPIAAGAKFDVVGEAPAGRPFRGEVGDGAVRIFTGSVVPPGSHHVIIQENVERDGDVITLLEDQAAARNIRPAGGDFAQGDLLIEAGQRATPATASLLAAAGHGSAHVFRRPKVAIFANGDELVAPGQPLKEGQIYNSVAAGLVPLFQSWGAEARFVGTAADRTESVVEVLEKAADADLVVPIGGASVGDYDVVKQSVHQFFDPVFSKVAVKPGKPVWFSARGSKAILGLPGNPASAFVCAHLFGRLAVAKLSGEKGVSNRPTVQATLGAPVEANGAREEFVRATMDWNESGQLVCTPLPKQDSSLLSTLSKAQGLLRRLSNATSAEAGSSAEVVLFERPRS